MIDHLNHVHENFAVIVACILLSSSCSKPTRQIQIELREGYSGRLHITLCAIPALRADEQGNGSVADCPLRSERIQLVVRRDGNVYQLSPDTLAVSRNSNGFPVSIDAIVP